MAMTNAVIPRRKAIPQINATAKTTSGERTAEPQCSREGPLEIGNNVQMKPASQTRSIARPKIQVAISPARPPWSGTVMDEKAVGPRPVLQAKHADTRHQYRRRQSAA